LAPGRAPQGVDPLAAAVGVVAKARSLSLDRRAPERPAARQRPSRPMSNVQLVECICEVSVPLREAMRVHMQAYGVLIPHIFMSDVLKRIGVCLLGGRANALDNYGSEIRGIVDALERGMTEGDRETRNVIAISFARDSEVELFFDELVPLLGPRTRAQLAGK